MYMYYEYTKDSTFLQNVAYPFMKEAVIFLKNALTWNGTQYYMASSNARENYWDIRNSLPDLASIRSLFPAAIEASQILGVDSTLRTQWQDVVDDLVPYETDGTKYLAAYDVANHTRHNQETPELEFIYPYDLSGIGASDYSTAVSTFNARIPLENGWRVDMIQAAHLGLGDEALDRMKHLQTLAQITRTSAITYNNYLEIDGNGHQMAAINESLLQSYNNKIRVFPAPLTDSSFVGKFSLLAEGGFIVSSEREAGEIKYVGLKSLYGSTATLVNPWGTEQVRVRRTSDNAILMTTSSSQFNFNTSANGIYVVERTAKP